MKKYTLKKIGDLKVNDKVLFHGGIFIINSKPQVSPKHTIEMNGMTVIGLDCAFIKSDEAPVLRDVLKQINFFTGFWFKEFKVLTR